MSDTRDDYISTCAVDAPRPSLDSFDLSGVSEPKDGILYLYRSDVDGFWYVDSDEDMALQEASGYPVGELVEYEAEGSAPEIEEGDLLAIFLGDPDRYCGECGEPLYTDADVGWKCLTCNEPREGPSR